MNRVITVPKDRDHWLALRRHDITSTEISALFGVSPYLTAYGLWHAKQGHIDTDFEANERMTWGTRLQDAIGLGICEDEGIRGWRKEEYISLPGCRLGSSFDFETDNGLLEVKNVDSLQHRNQWLEIDGQIEAPVHIELQAQQQMLVSGIDNLTIGALIGGNRVQLLRRRADPVIHALILKKAAAFWQSIADGTEPEMTFPADTAVIARLYNYADPGSVVNLDSDRAFMDTLTSYSTIGAQIKALEARRDECKARILMAIGSAEKAYANQYTVTAGMVAGAHIEYDRAPYRQFRVT